MICTSGLKNATWLAIRPPNKKSLQTNHKGGEKTKDKIAEILLESHLIGQKKEK